MGAGGGSKMHAHNKREGFISSKTHSIGGRGKCIGHSANMHNIFLNRNYSILSRPQQPSSSIGNVFVKDDIGQSDALSTYIFTCCGRI